MTGASSALAIKLVQTKLGGIAAIFPSRAQSDHYFSTGYRALHRAVEHRRRPIVALLKIKFADRRLDGCRGGNNRIDLATGDPLEIIQ